MLEAYLADLKQFNANIIPLLHQEMVNIGQHAKAFTNRLRDSIIENERYNRYSKLTSDLAHIR